MDKITSIRRFFKISNAAFEMQQTIAEAFGKRVPRSYMHSLHKIALIEINKKDPNMELINKLLIEMENEAEKNNSKNG